MPAEDHAHGCGELDIAESEPGRRDEMQGEVDGKEYAAGAEGPDECARLIIGECRNREECSGGRDRWEGERVRESLAQQVDDDEDGRQDAVREGRQQPTST